MSDFNSNFRSGGPRRSPRFGRRDFGSGDREMHKAVCAECGAECQVPFRPSGDRPVYCSNCFEKRSNEEGDSRGGDRRDFSRPRFENQSRPSYSGGNDRPNPAVSPLDSQILDQLKSINAKIERLVVALTPKQSENVNPVEPQLKETPSKVVKPKAKKKSVEEKVVVA